MGLKTINLRRNKKKPLYIKEQEAEYDRLMSVIEDIAISIFEWENLPEGLESRYIERYLFESGMLCFFKANPQEEEMAGLYALPVARAGELNVYSQPTKYECISPKRNFTRSISNSVLIFNTPLYIPTIAKIDTLVAEAVDIKFAAHVNRNSACKTPPVFRVTDKNQLSAFNKYEEIVGNKPILVEDYKGMLPPDYGMGGDRPPYWGAELRAEYREVISEILTIIGVISNPVEKAERVNTIEASSNRGEIVDNIDTMLFARQRQIEKINTMFMSDLEKPIGIKINNRYTKNMILQQLDPDTSEPIEEEGDDNGNA